MDGKQLPVFGFQITRILDCGFFVEEAINVIIENAQIGYVMNFSFSIENNWIEYLVRTDLREKDSNATFLSGTVLTKFSINSLASFLNEEGKLDFPNGSLEVLFGISFGHLRAILAKNASGTKFRDFIIPPINQYTLFNDLLQENIERFKQISSKTSLEHDELEESKPPTKKSQKIKKPNTAQ